MPLSDVPLNEFQRTVINSHGSSSSEHTKGLGTTCCYADCAKPWCAWPSAPRRLDLFSLLIHLFLALALSCTLAACALPLWHAWLASTTHVVPSRRFNSSCKDAWSLSRSDQKMLGRSFAHLLSAKVHLIGPRCDANQTPEAEISCLRLVTCDVLLFARAAAMTNGAWQACCCGHVALGAYRVHCEGGWVCSGWGSESMRNWCRPHVESQTCVMRNQLCV